LGHRSQAKKRRGRQQACHAVKLINKWGLVESDLRARYTTHTSWANKSAIHGNRVRQLESGNFVWFVHEKTLQPVRSSHRANVMINKIFTVGARTVIKPEEKTRFFAPCMKNDFLSDLFYSINSVAKKKQYYIVYPSWKMGKIVHWFYYGSLEFNYIEL